MTCSQCDRKEVILLQHGALCKNHFINYFEDKVFKTIKKYQLINRNDKICVAASGGKDSLTVLYLTKKYLTENKIETSSLFALAIDEGIKGYRKTTLTDLKAFCKKHQITLHIVSNKTEFGHTLDKAYPLINKQEHKKPCNICGVWRRHLLNKYAKRWGATKVVTGHNLDDEAQVIIMNLFKANSSLAASIGPTAGIEDHAAFAQRVKPLYFCLEKETKLYSLLKGFQVQFVECPYSGVGYRAHVRDMLNDFEAQYKGTKQGIVKSFLEILPLLKEKERTLEKKEMKLCSQCHEPCQGLICNACKIREALKRARK